jgi:dipeptidase D
MLSSESCERVIDVTTGILNDLKPCSVFSFFEEISRIPRGSGNEKGISDYLVSFAKERNLEVIQDSALNVIIKKKAAPGYENAPTVIIQGHLDMVNEKNADTVHDFYRDPLKLVVDGDFVRAKGTTLGADNGIAVAYAMALLDSGDIPHPPLEVLLTTDEETGMGGAMGLNPENINGRILINIDSEEEGKLLVSCAGGLRAKVTLPIKREAAGEGLINCTLKVRGLKGGHSGMDINKERGNSNKIMGRLLVSLLDSIKLQVCSINGGAKNNAIPREADAHILIEEKDIEILRENIKNWNAVLKNEYCISEPDIRIELEVFGSREGVEVFARDTMEKAIKLLYLMPNGIQTMSMGIPGLVQSSTNLGVVTTAQEFLSYDSALRSSVRSLKTDILNQMKLIAEAFGAEISTQSEYPEWQYDPDSEIRTVFQRVHKKVYGHEAEIVAIHAGVECGLFKEKFGEIDMISFGPNLYDVHTPNERVSISSTERTWKYLLEVLKDIK